MGLKDDIIKKVSSILDETFDVEEITYVPDIENSKLTFGNKGMQFEATVLYIDMRGSTKILEKHNKPIVAKIHMSYFHTIVKVANSLGGEVRSFNGDSMLVFFQGTTKRTLSSAVKAAMQMKYMISDKNGGINELLAKYTPIDYGIGLDDGKILCTKIGVSGNNNKDLIWIGMPVNKAVVLSDKSKNPRNIAISSYVYNNLEDDVKYHVNKDKETINMWKEAQFQFNNEELTYYYTTYQWIVS